MTTQERTDLFSKVDRLVRDRYFDPKFNGKNWPALVEKHRSRIEGAGTDEVFEAEVNSLLHLLGTSHTPFSTLVDREFRAAVRSTPPLRR